MYRKTPVMTYKMKDEFKTLNLIYLCKFVTLAPHFKNIYSIYTGYIQYNIYTLICECFYQVRWLLSDIMLENF